MAIINDLIMAQIPFKELSLNGITSTLDLGDIYIHFNDDGTLNSIVPKEKILHTIIGNDGITRIYSASYDKKVAKKVLRNMQECPSRYLHCELVSIPIDKAPPKLTWLFFWNSTNNSWDIEVTEPDDAFDPEWADCSCIVVKAETLAKAKKLAKKQGYTE